jgi:RNA polymerase sigma-70 factor (ECF subfamily)
MTELSIDDIIKGCKEGHAPCQKALVNRYSGLLYSICLRYIGDETKSQDALQDAFIRIFKYIKTFDSDKGSLQAWMRKIAVNTALKTIQSKIPQSSSLSIDINNNLSIEPKILDKMAADEVLAVIQSLPDGYRQVFNLSVIEGYSHKEIAAMLDIKEVSSRSNLSRAKQLLRTKLLSFKNSESWAKIV